MATTREIELGEFNIGSVDRFRVTITKDEVAWSGIDSVQLVLESPDRETQVTKTMVLDDDSLGRWYYDTVTTDLDTVGRWTANVRVTDGSIVKRYPFEIGFNVNDNP